MAEFDQWDPEFNPEYLELDPDIDEGWDFDLLVVMLPSGAHMCSARSGNDMVAHWHRHGPTAVVLRPRAVGALLDFERSRHHLPPMDPDLGGSSRCRARCLQPLKVHAILKPSCHVVFQPLAVHAILQPSCYQLLAVCAILPPRRQPLAVVAIFFLLKGQRPSAIAAASRASAFFHGGRAAASGQGMLRRW